MRVVLFGASGSIGRHVRAQARDAGHDLVLFSRDPDGLKPLAENERVVVGDIANLDEVSAAVADVEAVVSALGPTSRGSDQVRLFQAFARTLVGAMQATGARRLVSVSGAACTMPGEKRSLSQRAASGLVRVFVPHVVEAKQRELDVIAASHLDWVAPRPPRVVDGRATGAYRVGPSLGSNRVTAGNLAEFMVRQLTDDEYLRQAPYVSD